MQDSDRQTGSSYNSGSVIDRIEIPTAILRFPELPVPMYLWPIPTDVLRHRKRKIAAEKPGIVLTDVLEEVDSKFQIVIPRFQGLPS